MHNNRFKVPVKAIRRMDRLVREAFPLPTVQCHDILAVQGVTLREAGYSPVR